MIIKQHYAIINEERNNETRMYKLIAARRSICLTTDVHARSAGKSMRP